MRIAGFREFVECAGLFPRPLSTNRYAISSISLNFRNFTGCRAYLKDYASLFEACKPAPGGYPESQILLPHSHWAGLSSSVVVLLRCSTSTQVRADSLLFFESSLLLHGLTAPLAAPSPSLPKEDVSLRIFASDPTVLSACWLRIGIGTLVFCLEASTFRL
ncbi:hypothetical protein NPIL_181651 [Nephila pilipes]|uniref:Uncharacterized protein n=1 Tax=Nephila pilipes TaxID=299642 RepID=A0A8X6U1H2_NEPPI|nr:hypothetical protein NPIL_181651 [Nephila pilipes]